MKALILSAGFATRMYPLTLNQAKPLLEIGGKPMLTWLSDSLLQIPEVDELIIIGNEKFNEQFEAWGASYKSRAKVSVLNDGSTDDSNKLGAIGDMNFALRWVPEGEDFLVVAGDNLFEFNPADFYAEFKKHRQPLIVVREIESRGARSRYNEVTINDEGIVTNFREKPPDPQTNIAAICFYFFPPEVKGMIKQYLDEGNNPDAPGYFIQWLVKQTPVRAVRFSTPWFDIGNLETLEEARARYKGQ